jgi:hypothetical protein
MPDGSASRWLAVNGTSGPMSQAAPWWRTRGKRAHRRVDETRELVVSGRVVDPEQVDIWEAGDALATEARTVDTPPTLDRPRAKSRDESQLVGTGGVGSPRGVSRGVRACPSCGHRPGRAAEAEDQRADLDIVWLLVDGEHVEKRRHCARCQPRGPVLDVTCQRCGAGPLITGDAVDTGDQPSPRVLCWLQSHGWHTEGSLLCPAHAP